MTYQPCYFYLASMICPMGQDLAPKIFYRKCINCPLKHGEICRSDISKQTKKAPNEKKLLEIREVGKKTCGKPYPPSLNSPVVIQLFSEGEEGGRDSKAYLGLKRDRQLKTIWCINRLNFKKQINLSAVSEFPPTVSSASKALDTSTASSSATQSAGRYFP